MLPLTLQTLVTKFKDNIESYKHSSYNETQLRREFLDKFVKILGWDVDNEEGLYGFFKEVIHEDRLRVGTSIKVPDYCMQIGGRKLFYIEAKKPSVKIMDDMEAAFQVRRYGWTAQMPACLLTDFEEFSVYNTGIKPKNTDKPGIARIFYCRYDELEKKNLQYPEYENNWSYLESLFSKDAVKRGSLEKIKSRDKKGTQEVDKEFLKEIEDWREQLTNNLVLRNALSEREVNFAVQKIIDRIIFLRICEDRGIETKNTLQNIATCNDIYPALLKLFLTADDKYNSGLFHFHKEQGFEDTLDTLTRDLKIDDKPLRNIIKSLYYPAPYVFSAMPADILGSIYERFLGKVIRLTSSHRAKIEEKPEVRKAGGVYYTPQYIVNYIVENTIGKQLFEKTPKTLKNFRVLDPACGSGSFLINAYQFLLDWHLKEYVKNADYYCKQKALVKVAADSFKLSIRERKRILTEHIFGVDIDIQAVEVTKLSLLLKALEGLQEQEIQVQLFHERILPNLGNNIKCGNSLIGTDFYEQGTLNFSEEEQIKINCFDWRNEFGEVFKDGGFDVVIGNPPYVRIQTIDKNQTDYFKQNYKGAVYGNYDLYILFIERSLMLLATNGLYGMILPHKFFQAEYGEGIRKIIENNRNVVQINNFTTNQVFENATTYTCLLFLSKNNNDNFIYQEIKTGNSISDLLNSPSFDTILSSKLAGKWNFNNSIEEAIFEKINKNIISLRDISRKIFKGSSTGNDEVYLVRLISKYENYSVVHSTILNENIEIENDILKPFIYGQDVRRFHINSTTNYIIFPYKIESKATLVDFNILKSDYPLTSVYFERVRKILIKRKLEFGHSDFYKYSAGRSLLEYNQKKILIPDMLVESRIGIDVCGEYYHGPAIHSFVINEEYNFLHYNYILALLSSKIFWFFISHTSTALRGNAFRLTPEFINPFPIKIIDKNDKSEVQIHNHIVSLVDKMLISKKKEQTEKLPPARAIILRQISALEKEIDGLVYGLYGLSEGEIRVVEGIYEK